MVADPTQHHDRLPLERGYVKRDVVEIDGIPPEFLKRVAQDIEFRVEGARGNDWKNAAEPHCEKMKIVARARQQPLVELHFPSIHVASPDFHAGREDAHELLNQALMKERMSTVHFALRSDPPELGFLRKPLIGDRSVGEEESGIPV